jgi:hypothetical protein
MRHHQRGSARSGIRATTSKPAATCQHRATMPAGQQHSVSVDKRPHTSTRTSSPTPDTTRAHRDNQTQGSDRTTAAQAATEARQHQSLARAGAQHNRMTSCVHCTTRRESHGARSPQAAGRAGHLHNIAVEAMPHTKDVGLDTGDSTRARTMHLVIIAATEQGCGAHADATHSDAKPNARQLSQVQRGTGLVHTGTAIGFSATGVAAAAVRRRHIDI